MKKHFIQVVVLFVLIGTILFFSCKKKKNPFPDFPKDENALTTPINLPYYDSLNYGTSVAEFGIPAGWLEAAVTGAKDDRGWAYRATYGLNGGPSIYDGCILASAFGGNLGTDNTYLIVGPFNLANFSSVQLSFDFRVEYDTGPGSISFKYSTNYPGSGNPEASGVSWTDLSGINSQLPTTNTAYTNISSSFSLQTNNVFIGIHFSGGMSSNSKRFRIDNFWLK